MNTKIALIGVVLVVGAVLPLAAAAQTQGPAKQGNVDAVVTDTTTGKGLDLGTGKTLYALDSVLVLHSAEGGGLLDNMTGHCLGLEEVEDETGAATLTGYCTYIDAGGDKIFETVKLTRPSGDEEASGTATLTGGTGKFEGIRGELTKTRRLLASLVEGVFPGIGRITGSYSIGQ